MWALGQGAPKDHRPHEIWTEIQAQAISQAGETEAQRGGAGLTQGLAQHAYRMPVLLGCLVICPRSQK